MRMSNPDYPWNDRHSDSNGVEHLVERAELVKEVVRHTGFTTNQVLDLMRTESINRMTEILLDAEDNLRMRLDDIQKNRHEEIRDTLNWLYDNQPLKIKIEED